MTQPGSMWERAKSLVGEALDLPEADRAGFVTSRCGADTTLRAEVESLLEASCSSSSMIRPDIDAWISGGGGEAALGAGARLGGYTVERVIASGATSVVYLARQESASRLVALKVFRAGLPLLGGSTRAVVEAAAAGRIEHPNVARMYDAGVLRTESGGRHRYLAMEYVEGLPITEHARARALTEPQIVRLLVRVASAVRAFHQRAVIHRDLKPSNILVDASGEPKVLDFGVARLLPSAGWTLETIDGAVLGTPGYMSPEQIETPRDIDVRADVWSLGVLAYEMLSGRLPIDISGLSAVEAVRRVARSEPAPLSRVAPRVRPDLARVVMKALSRDREARYGSAEALLEDLENAISDRPVSARDGGWAYRAAKLVRRRRAPIAAAAAVLAVGSVIAAMQVAAWRRAAVQRDRAIAVNTLLAGMINSASPHFGDRNVLMRDVLVGLEAGLADRSVGMPLVEADVRSLLGRMSFALGEYERSRALLEEAIALREGGGDLAARLSDRGALATTLRWLYLPEEAMRIAEAAESEARRSLGPRHPTTLEVREVVAGCLDDLGRIDEAERIYRGLLAQRLGAGEGRSDAALVTMGSLASLLSRSGKYAESETLGRQAAEGWSARGQRLEALTVRANLAMVVASQGRLDEAITMYEVIDAEALEALGPTHSTTISARGNLVESLRRAGRSADIVALERELLDRCVETLGWGHEQTIWATQGLVAALIGEGRSDEALETAAAGWEAARLLPDTSVLRHRMLTILAAAMGAAGRHTEALEAYAAAIDFFDGALGPSHQQTILARNNMGVALIDAGMAADAVHRLRQAIAAAQSAGRVEMEPVVRRNLGRALIAAGDAEHGVRELEAAFASSTARGERANAAACASILAEHHGRAGDQLEHERWRLAAEGLR